MFQIDGAAAAKEAISDIETRGCTISLTLTSVYVKLGADGAEGAIELIAKSTPNTGELGADGIEGDVQVGTKSVDNLLNSEEQE